MAPVIVKPKAVRPATAVAQDKAAAHFSQMSSAFRDKAQQFAQQVITEVKQPPPPPAVTVEPPAAAGNDPHLYNKESRSSEFGTRHIDPDTGLIYFKYDFGYEFGLVLPGQPEKVDKIVTAIGAEPGSIELPVLHEKSPAPSPSSTLERRPTAAPNFQPKKFPFKPTAKWEPTDSEMSDGDLGGQPGKKYYAERKAPGKEFPARPASRS